MNTAAAIFFDLDGTLTNPKEGIVHSVKFALDKLGIASPPADELDWCIGPPLLDSLERLVGERVKAQEALTVYRERFARIGLYENVLCEGIVPGLSELSASKARLYAATSKPLIFAEQILSHVNIDGYFTGVFGAELDGTRADKTELLAYALKVTEADARRSVMVGDRRHDIRGALNNGLATIGVLYGYGDRIELIGAGAERLYETPQELVKALVQEV